MLRHGPSTVANDAAAACNIVEHPIDEPAAIYPVRPGGTGCQVGALSPGTVFWYAHEMHLHRSRRRSETRPRAAGGIPVLADLMPTVFDEAALHAGRNEDQPMAYAMNCGKPVLNINPHALKRCVLK